MNNQAVIPHGLSATTAPESAPHPIQNPASHRHCSISWMPSGPRANQREFIRLPRLTGDQQNAGPQNRKGPNRAAISQSIPFLNRGHPTGRRGKRRLAAEIRKRAAIRPFNSGPCNEWRKPTTKHPRAGCRRHPLGQTLQSPSIVYSSQSSRPGVNRNCCKISIPIAFCPH